MARVIVIDSCSQCKFLHDWSSGGAICYKADPKDGKVIVQGYESRKPLERETPQWCPLPEIKAVQI